MYVRSGGANPVILAAARGLGWVNRRHPWNHNDHFHGWISRRLPCRRRRALDVGCGAGALVGHLTPLFERVVGVDRDRCMVAAAQTRLGETAGVQIVRGDLLALPPSVGGPGRYDLITMVASLHHMPLEEALHRVRELLAPGGRLLVVGLARVETRTDLVVDVASALANPVVGLIKHPRVSRAAPPWSAMPVRDPAESFADIAALAARVLPGARVRRRLFFRYTLEWERPIPRGASRARLV